jgi:MFS family permease
LNAPPIVAQEVRAASMSRILQTTETRMNMETRLTPHAGAGDEATYLNPDDTYRKVTIRIIPFLLVCYVISFLDRINISFAILSMKAELGFTETVYGFAAGAYAIGYIIFEVPSNLVLERIGARKTFLRIMFLWGLASVSLMFVRHPSEFYVIRFILGCFEAGFFPGVLLYLTYWYPQGRRAGIVSWFFAGVAIAGLAGGLMSGFIMERLHGVSGLSGWQWMFILEGLPASVLGVVAYYYLGDGPGDVSWLSDTEKTRIANDLFEDELASIADSTKGQSLLSALADWRVYVLSFIYFGVACGTFVISFWLPTIIKEAGVKSVVQVSLYSAIPYSIGIIGIIGISRHSDKRGERRWHYCVCSILGAMAICGMTLKGLNLPELLAFATAAVFFGYGSLPVFWAASTSYLRKKAAAGGIALVSSIGMLGGFVSPLVIGVLKDRTGSLSSGIYLMECMFVIGGLLILVMPKRQKKLEARRIESPVSEGA